MRRPIALLAAAALTQLGAGAQAASVPAADHKFAPASNHRPELAAQAQSPGAPFIGIASQPTIYVPGVSAPSYAPPPIFANLAMVYGDSRAANAGDAIYSSPAFSTEYAFANTWAAELPWQTNNAILFSSTYNYGVGAQTSAGIYSRLQATGIDCNNATISSGVCFTGQHTTTSGATSTTGMTVANGTGITVGEYVFASPQGSPSYLGPQVTVAAVSGTLVTLSAAPLNTIPSGTAITFSPTVHTNNFWNGLDATLTGWSLTDPNFNSANVGSYSAFSDPAKLVFFMTGTNDANLPTLQALRNQAAIFDTLGPAGANKVVIAGNEIPRGLATAILEKHSVPASTPFTITSTNASGFYSDIGVYYAPNNSANALGASDGIRLTSVNYPCTPSTGQYCVNLATGVYSFASGDASAQVVLQYRWTSNSGGSYLTDIHDWLDSASCGGSFTAPISGHTFSISGAQCNRPWLTVVDTWDQIYDTATGTNYLPIPFFSIDGLHPIPYAGALIAKAMAVPAAPLVGTSPALALPTVNNSLFGGNTSSATTSHTYDATQCPSITGTTVNYWMTALSPTATSSNTGTLSGLGYPPIYSAGMKIYAPSSHVPAGSIADCIDLTNNQLHLVAPGAVTGTNANTVGQQDTNSIAANAVFSHLLYTTPTVASCNGHCGTPSTGYPVAGLAVPTNWTFGLAAAQTTDLNSGVLGVLFGVETNPLGDGYDDFIVQVQGVAASGGLAINLTSSTIAAMTTSLITAGDQHRASCKVQISAGPNGHLWGVYWPAISAIDTVGSGNYEPPGSLGSTYTNWGAQAGGGGTGIEMTDKDLSNGNGTTITVQMITPPTNTTGMTAPGATQKIFVGSDSGVPVSATFRFSRCTDEKVSN